MNSSTVQWGAWCTCKLERVPSGFVRMLCLCLTSLCRNSNTLILTYTHCCHTLSSLLSPSPLSLFSTPLSHPHSHPVAPNIPNKPANPVTVINSGATATITVNYNPGNPLATVQWSKDGQLINSSSEPHISAAPNSTILMLTNNNSNIRGRYLVNVSNIGGSDTFEYNVKAVCKSFVKYIGIRA